MSAPAASKSDTPNDATEEDQFPLTLQVLATKLVLGNTSDADVTRVKVQIFPPPLNHSILLMAYSYEIEDLEVKARSSLEVPLTTLHNEAGRTADKAKRKIGAALVLTNFGGDSDGQMFLVSDDITRPAPKQEWSAVLDPILGED